jgi:D-galactose 1-dehydrogenase
MPDPVFVTDAQLEVPENCQTPIAATVQMSAGGKAQVSAAFDWRWQGPPQWDIAVQTTTGTITLKKGGAELWLDGALHSASEDHEYRRLYARFVNLIGRGESDVDVTPLQLAADAFLVGSRSMVEPFYD